MAGRKRSRDDDYDDIKRKIRKLEKQLKRSRSRRSHFSSSYESDSQSEERYYPVQSDDEIIEKSCSK